MVILTESSVLARSRVADLLQCTKLNVWGCSLTDISIVKQCRNLQVFSASCNDIVTLRDLVSCGNLQELYVRENQIADLDEVVQLKGLPRLRVLWLAGNPFCSAFGGDDERYRLWVLSLLPHLDRLDNTEVRADERKRVQNIDPDELLVAKPATVQAANTSASASPSTPATPSHSRGAASASGDYVNEGPPRTKPSTSASLPQSPGTHRGSESFGGGSSSVDFTSPSSKPVGFDGFPSKVIIRVSTSGVSEVAQVFSPVNHRRKPSQLYTPSPSSLPVVTSRDSTQSHHRRVPVVETPVSHSRQENGVADGRLSVSNKYVSAHRLENEKHMPLGDVLTSIAFRPMDSSLPRTQAKLRNVNILSAALTLVKELDNESLQILQLDIGHRLGEMQLGRSGVTPTRDHASDS